MYEIYVSFKGSLLYKSILPTDIYHKINSAITHYREINNLPTTKKTPREKEKVESRRSTFLETISFWKPPEEAGEAWEPPKSSTQPRKKDKL